MAGLIGWFRFVRAEGPSSALLALFDSAGAGLELSTKLIRCNPSALRTGCQLVDDEQAGGQVWRQSRASVAAAQEQLSSLGVEVPAWVAGAALPAGSPAVISVGDVVYLVRGCTIGLVEAVAADGHLVVAPATEVNLQQRHSKKATFQFLGLAPTKKVAPGDCAWPLDLQFDLATATFVLRKSLNLETV